MKHDFDDAELIELQQALHEIGGLRDDARADDAVARAMSHLANQTTRYKPRPYRRWIMRIGIAAVVALGIAVAFQLSTTTPVAAAELLRQAVQKQESVDRWITIRSMESSTGGADHVWSTQPKAGLYLYGDPSKPAEGFEMIDTVAGQKARFEPTLNLLIFTDFTKANLNDEARINSFPLTLDGLLKMPELANYDSKQADAGNVRTLIFTRRPTVTAPEMPAELTIEIDIDTGLLRKGTLRSKVGEAVKPFFEIDQKATLSLTKIDALPLPPGARILDLRTTDQARALLDAIDQVHRDGLGMDGALIVTTYVDGTDGTPKKYGRITLLVEREGKSFRGDWSVSADGTNGPEKHLPRFPEGWPKPTFAAALAAVKDHVCDNASIIVDGRRSDIRNFDPTKPIPASTQVGVLRGSKVNMIAGMIYPEGRSEGMAGYVKYEMSVTPRDKMPMLVVTDLTKWGKYPNELRTSRVQRWILRDARAKFPVPLMYDDAQFDEEGHEFMTRQRMDFDRGNPVIEPWSTRQIWLPTSWRRLSLMPDDSDAFTAFNHLYAAPGAEVPAEWFALPPVTTRRPQR